MFVIPSFRKEEEFLKTTKTIQKLEVIRKINRILLLTSSLSTSAEVIPFIGRKREEELILKIEKESSKCKTNFLSTVYAQFVTRVKTYIFFKEKKYEISDISYYGKMYIFDEQTVKGNEIKIISAKDLPNILGSLDGWDGLTEKVNKNPNKMTLLLNNNKIFWLKNYTLVSELKI